MDGDVADEAIEPADDATVVNRVEQALKDAGLNEAVNELDLRSGDGEV